MTPLITVVIACLNHISHLPRAVSSVLDQTFSDIELVIMDGASSDGTREYLQSLTDTRVTWRSDKDGGISQAWNKAVALSRGEWILFLGADDFVWDKDVFTRAAPYLTADTPAKLAFGEVQVVTEHGDHVIRTVWFDRPALMAQLRSPKGLGLPHQGFFHRRSAFEKTAFDTSFRIAADYEFISRFSAEADFLFLPIGPIAAFRLGGLSSDPWISILTYREFSRVHRRLGRPFLHGKWQLTKAHIKIWTRHLVGAKFAKRLVNISRTMRELPPY